ncbi:L-seryl-tRNA(Sec) kinase-like [Asterias rubens]|uniref:L-seryl-tRNA(Sec) kinase-like n=1 Tax=Asterias rubens TaxID=7604 RepID=UPI00145567A4|nr:L-seryl-tRNA(Sec) kinase-like [Asterias rubens]XP_033632506.1 L-seryl-tRNA(Sec) kinase-like [Asterias rubens]XP_033632508.1 L-seryl-tRNA(Sec) kinase-like [Asterias rubens]
MEETSLKVLERLGESKICLAALCGLPGAGKTSLAESLMGPCYNLHEGRPELRDPTVLHLCYDEVIPRHLQIEMIREDDAPRATTLQIPEVSPWKTYRKEIISSVDFILERIHCSKTLNLRDVFIDLDRHTRSQDISPIAIEVRMKLLSLFRDQLMSRLMKVETPPSSECELETSSIVFLIDDNMFYRSMRYEYYQLARKHSAGFCQIYLQCSSDEAIARNAKRQQAVSMETIIKMAGKMEAPNQQAASWERNVVQILVENVDSDDTLSALWSLISRALMAPESPLQEDNIEEKDSCRAVCATNVIHRVDQILRKCVAKTMTLAKDKGSMTKAELKTLAAKLNSVRQSLLQQVRDCTVVPPPLDAEETTSRGDEPNNFKTFTIELFDKQLEAS